MEPQFFVVRPDGTREGPFDRIAIDLMRTDGRITEQDSIEEVAAAATAEETGPGPAEEPRPSPTPTYAASPYSTPARKVSPLVWVLISLCVLCIPCVAVFGAILFPVFAQARLAAKATLEMQNLSKVGKATQVYATDFDDRFPPNMSSLEDAWPSLAPYVNIEMPVSGNEKSPTVSGNEGLSAAQTASIVAPQRTFEFFDSAPWINERRIVLFVDGHDDKDPESVFGAAQTNGFEQKPD